MKIKIFLFILVCISSNSVFGATLQSDGPARWSYQDNAVRIRVIARPDQGMAAFYEARGFPKPTLKVFSNKCFLTVSILNKSYPVLWLEPDRWEVRTADGKTLQRYSLDYWYKEFDSAGVPVNVRAAFRWTQLPEQRDLRPDEPVGGNITLPAMKEKVLLLMKFDIGSNRNETLELTVPDILCPSQTK